MPAAARPDSGSDRRQRENLRRPHFGLQGRRALKNTSLAEHLAVEVAVEIDSLLGRGSSDGIDLEAIETAARRQALGLAARAIEQKINADSSDYAGSHLPCGCGSW